MAPTSCSKLTIPQKILNATASLSKGTTKHVSKQKVLRLCGHVKTVPRSFTNQMGILKKKKQWIVVDGDDIALTEEGLKHAETTPPPANNEETWNQAKDKIKMGQGKKVFDFLCDGETRTYKEIGEKIGRDHEVRSFQNILGPLKTLGYIEYVTKDGEKACRMLDEVFPFGQTEFEDEEA
ncbi:MAG: hypothetical protein SGARI_008354 [Bacillariaceae sp.]